MEEAFVRVVMAMLGPVFAVMWVIVVLHWLRTPPPKPHAIWLVTLAIALVLIAVPFYMGHGVLIVLAGDILLVVSGWQWVKVRQQHEQ